MGFYILRSGMITGTSRGTLNRERVFQDFEIGVVLLMSLRINQRKLPFRCCKIFFTLICTLNSPWLRFSPFLPSRWKTMKLKSLLYGVPLITTMITNHPTRWKTMQIKALIYGVPLISFLGSLRGQMDDLFV